MDPASELEYEMPGVLRVYKSGRVDRFDGTDTVPPYPSGDPANGVASKDVVLDPAANISARLYLPAAAAAAVEPGKKFPVVVFFHGGAFMVHTAASPLYHMYVASLAAATPAVVVSVDYRLVPEHRVPAAYDDAFFALKAVVTACRPDGAEPWLAAHGDASRIVLAGDSAGANMAHNTAMRLRKEGIEGYGDKVSGVALLHPRRHLRHLRGSSAVLLWCHFEISGVVDGGARRLPLPPPPHRVLGFGWQTISDPPEMTESQNHASTPPSPSRPPPRRAVTWSSA